MAALLQTKDGFTDLKTAQRKQRLETDAYANLVSFFNMSYCMKYV